MDSDPGEGTSDGRVTRMQKLNRHLNANNTRATAKEKYGIQMRPTDNCQMIVYSRRVLTTGASQTVISESDGQLDSENDMYFMEEEMKYEGEEEEGLNTKFDVDTPNGIDVDNQDKDHADIRQGNSKSNDKRRNTNARDKGRNRILTKKRNMTNGSKKSRARQPKLHKCHSCNYTTSNKSHLTAHIRTHTGEKPFVCEICSKSFAVKSNLNGHKKIHLLKLAFHCSKCRIGFEQEIDKNNHQDKCQRCQFECHLCQYSTLILTHLKCHMRINHTGEKPFGCSVCTKTFRTKEHLRTHLSTHVRDLPFQCAKCGSRFVDENKKQSHEKQCNRRQYECYLCGYKRFKKDHLQLHMRSKHTAEKPFRCAVCKKQFARKNCLKQHLLIHTKRQPIRCSKCLRQFRNEADKKAHEDRCGRRHFECFLCKFKTQKMNHLKSHMKKTHI